MNDNFQMFTPMLQKQNCQCMNELMNLTQQFNIFQKELKRLERRILNLEKSLISSPSNKFNTSPMEYNNLNYTNENYII